MAIYCGIRYVLWQGLPHTLKEVLELVSRRVPTEDGFNTHKVRPVPLTIIQEQTKAFLKVDWHIVLGRCWCCPRQMLVLEEEVWVACVQLIATAMRAMLRCVCDIAEVQIMTSNRWYTSMSIHNGCGEGDLCCYQISQASSVVSCKPQELLSRRRDLEEDSEDNTKEHTEQHADDHAEADRSVGLHVSLCTKYIVYMWLVHVVQVQAECIFLMFDCVRLQLHGVITVTFAGPNCTRCLSNSCFFKSIWFGRGTMWHCWN